MSRPDGVQSCLLVELRQQRNDSEYGLGIWRQVRFLNFRSEGRRWIQVERQRYVLRKRVRRIRLLPFVIGLAHQTNSLTGGVGRLDVLRNFAANLGAQRIGAIQI